MLNSGDMVEEIATNRRGRVAQRGTVGVPVSRLLVQFIDGKQPLIKDFTNMDDLRLVEHPGEAAAPGLYPERWVV